MTAGLENMWAERREDRKQQGDDARSAYNIDYSRVVHSASFRRLQGKTQILSLGDGDFYRTRLTHSLEVSQIATGIIGQLEKAYAEKSVREYIPSQNLIQTICLNHDLGHPPFGHGGEVALNYCMKENGGFEGNGQSLRILSKLEKFSESAGSNLTRRTLLGLLKYPAPYSSLLSPDIKAHLSDIPTTVRIIDRNSSKPPKCYLDTEKDVVDWIVDKLDSGDKSEFLKIKEGGLTKDKKQKHKKTVHKSFDCSIMDISDDIAYGVHDFEDAIALGLVSEAQFREDVPEAVCSKFLDSLKNRYKEEFENDVYSIFVKNLFSTGKVRKRQIGRLVHHFISNIEVYEENGFKEPLLKYRARISEGYKEFLEALKSFVRERVILSPRVQHLEFKGQTMVVSVFETFSSEPKAFLPPDVYDQYKEAGEDMRVICDHIAGMTDNFLMKTYDRLFSPRMGSVFDKL